MKKLNINSIGRMPLMQKDLEWMTQDLTSVLQDVIHEIGLDTNYFIITGCQISIEGDSLSMTPGWAYYDGEILPVRGLENVDVSSILGDKYVKLVRTEYDNPDGARRFRKADETDVVVDDVWQDDYLNPVVTGTSAVSGFFIRQNPWTLADRLRKGINDDSGWIQSGVVSYRKVGNMVFLNGTYFDDAVGYEDHTLAMVPSPSVECVFPCVGSGVTSVRISRSGNLLVSGSVGARYSFSHIVYVCDSKYARQDSNTYSTFEGGGGGAEI